jgi:hypothetical protein
LWIEQAAWRIAPLSIAIGNRKSTLDNLQSTVDNRQSTIGGIARMRSFGLVRLCKLSFACVVLLRVACPASAAEGQAVEVPGISRIESNVPVAPPGWAVLERRLIDVLSEAAVQYVARYTRSGGTLIWKTSGAASLDDLPESFYNIPLLYALGGDERLREISFREWNATARQLTDDFHVLHNEFGKHGDWFHIGEGTQFFYLLALVDPTDHETVARARRFAGLYMNEEPEAPNYDARRKLIRSPHTGSLGPEFGEPEKAAPYGWSKGMATYGLPLEDLPGIATMEDLKDPEKARRMGRAMAERMERGDVPIDLAATSLMANAYLFTGEQKYADWVKEYVETWLERTRQNGGITPDNVGLDGIAGEAARVLQCRNGAADRRGLGNAGLGRRSPLPGTPTLEHGSPYGHGQDCERRVPGALQERRPGLVRLSANRPFAAGLLMVPFPRPRRLATPGETALGQQRGLAHRDALALPEPGIRIASRAARRLLELRRGRLGRLECCSQHPQQGRSQPRRPLAALSGGSQSGLSGEDPD